MASYNKVILLGNLTRDPELRYAPNQTAVAEFGLATNRRWAGQDGQKKEGTCFIDCTAFGKQADVIAKYCKKGAQLLVEGRLKFDSWQAQDGSRRSKLGVIVETFHFMGGRPEGKSEGKRDPDTEPPMGEFDDEDIPF